MPLWNRRPVHFFHHPQFKEAPVENASKAVEICQLLDAFHVVRVLDGSRANIGHRFERLDIAVLETSRPLAFVA